MSAATRDDFIEPEAEAAQGAAPLLSHGETVDETVIEGAPLTCTASDPHGCYLEAATRKDDDYVSGAHNLRSNAEPPGQNRSENTTLLPEDGDGVVSRAEPRTRAGRYLLRALDGGWFTARMPEARRSAILDIEAEAGRGAARPCEICHKPGHDAESCPAAEWGDLAAPPAGGLPKALHDAAEAHGYTITFPVGGSWAQLAEAEAQEPNHYDWFMPDNPTAAVDESLDDFEAKMREALTDVYVHDMAQFVLPLIAAYREARSTPADALDDLQLKVAAVFQDHRQQGANACTCGWRPNIDEPSWEYHQHLMLKVLEVLGVRDE